MKPLDVVKTPKGALAIVTEVLDAGGGYRCFITFFGGGNPTDEKNAWWGEDDGLAYVDSIPRILSNAMAHPFGSNRKQGDRCFPAPGGGA